MDSDKILTSTPVNSTANRVLSKGFQYTPDKRITQPHWETCPPLRPVPDEKSLVNLIGRQIGKLTVVGVWAERPTKKAGRKKGKTIWIVRCQCGHYETRRAKSINNPRNKDDCCDLCRYIEHLKWVSRGKEQ